MQKKKKKAGKIPINLSENFIIYLFSKSKIFLRFIEKIYSFLYIVCQQTMQHCTKQAIAIRLECYQICVTLVALTGSDVKRS